MAKKQDSTTTKTKTTLSLTEDEVRTILLDWANKNYMQGAGLSSIEFPADHHYGFSLDCIITAEIAQTVVGDLHEFPI